MPAPLCLTSFDPEEQVPINARLAPVHARRGEALISQVSHHTVHYLTTQAAHVHRPQVALEQRAGHISIAGENGLDDGEWSRDGDRPIPVRTLLKYGILHAVVFMWCTSPCQHGPAYEPVVVHGPDPTHESTHTAHHTQGLRPWVTQVGHLRHSHAPLNYETPYMTISTAMVLMCNGNQIKRETCGRCVYFGGVVCVPVTGPAG